MTTKRKMCLNKYSFRNREKAETVAKRWGQRVYECPICFCWHCTTKENWREDFVDSETVKRELARRECEIRTELNVKIRELGRIVSELSFENGKLRKENKRLIDCLNPTKPSA